LLDAVEVERVLHLWTCDASGMTFAEAQARGLYALLGLARAQGERALSVTVLTRGLVSVADEPVSLQLAPLLGAARVLTQETPLGVRLIDLPADAEPTPAQVMAELAADEPCVALRGAARWLGAMHRVPAHALGPDLPLQEGGVYVVLGGLGLVGLALAERLAALKARLVLTSRSGLVARSEWSAWLAGHAESDPTSRRIRRIQALEAMGAEVLVQSADLADRERMAQVFAGARERFGRVDGVIHAAGIAGRDAFRAVQDTLPVHCETHFRARVQGTDVLAGLLPAEARFCLLCSSVATRVGGVGLFAYAAANAYLDAFAAERARRGDARWLAVGWDAWRPPEGGAQGPMGELGLTAEEGSALFERALRLGLPQVAVSTVDLERRIAHADRPVRPAEPRPGDSGGMHARPELACAYVEPRDALEASLVGIWQQLFRIEPIGVEDNFFLLGGDSLLAIQLGTRLRDQLGVDISVNDLFEEATIASLARKVEAVRATAGGAGAIGAGQEEREIAAVLAMVEGLSDEEVNRMLSELDE
jgi:NAD(P)-dependent dehydrogenase (short-subunit alcohol dehydrogenase family)/acyl carrier protein